MISSKQICLFRLCEFRNFAFKKTRSKVTYLMEAKFLVLIFFSKHLHVFSSDTIVENLQKQLFPGVLQNSSSASFLYKRKAKKRGCGYLKMSLNFYEVFPLESFSVEFEAVGVQLFSNKSHHEGIN